MTEYKPMDLYSVGGGGGGGGGAYFRKDFLSEIWEGSFYIFLLFFSEVYGISPPQNPL